MDELHLGYALVGSLAVVLAAMSTRVRNLPVSEALLALLLGVVAGPHVLGLIHVPEDQRPRLMTEVARVLLAVSLMGVGLRYPARRLRAVVSPTAVLVTVGMIGMAALSAGLMWLVLGVPIAVAVLLGACITPTDPVLASSVVTGRPAEKHLPLRTRQLLSVESGTNDGLALPLVLVGVALVLGESWGRATVDGLYQVGVGVIVGLVAGWVAGRVIGYAARHADVDQGSTLVFTLVLAIAVLGLARVAHADGVLSVFVASLAYNYVVANDEVGPQNTIDEAVNRYLVLPLFLLLGTQLPWAQWRELGWAAVVLPVAILVLRRPPVLLALARPLGLRLRDVVFLGWFGPIGVSALFYLALAEEEGVTDPRVWVVGTLVVAASTLAHGVSAAPGRRLYRRAAAAEEATHP
jgi:sodium/hydrogen antiporter